MHPKENFKLKINELIENERSRTCGKERSDVYAKNHKKRFHITLDICKKYVPDRNSRVLDIGRSNLTVLLSNYYNNVSSLGFNIKEDDGGHRENIEIRNVPHIVYNLNESKNITSWPDYPENFDLIVFCETLEHIYTAPEYILLMFKYLLKPRGLIILTTPNAVSFHKRIILLRGKNPAERIRFYDLNPGDYRQYIRNEIINIAKNCELRIVECRNINFYSSKYIAIRFLQRIPQLKDSIFAILSR